MMPQISFIDFFLEYYSVTHQAMIQIDLQTYLGEEHLGSDMEKMNTPTDDLPFNGDWFMGIMCSKSLFFVHVPTNRYVWSRQFSNIRKS